MGWGALAIAQPCNNVSGATFNSTIGTSAVPTPSDFNYQTGTQLGRIFRDGIASTCLGKACPGDFNTANSYYYDTYSFINNSANAECIEIGFDVGTCGTNVHAMVFLGSYTPPAGAGQLCGSNTFLGDVGSSTTQPFVVEIPAGATFTVVMSNTASLQICDYSFTLNPVTPGVVISGTGCVAVPTLSQWGIFLFMLSLVGLGLIVVYNVQTRQQLAYSGFGQAELPGSGYQMGSLFVPFARDGYVSMIKWSLLLAVAGFVLIYLIWGEIVQDDLIGMSVAVPLVAYILFLLKKDN